MFPTRQGCRCRDVAGPKKHPQGEGCIGLKAQNLAGSKWGSGVASGKPFQVTQQKDSDCPIFGLRF